MVLSRFPRADRLALSFVALAALSGGAAGAASLPASELTDWDVTGWSVAGAAACGVVLTKAGYLGGHDPSGASDRDRLAQGLALDALSKAADPEMNRAAWETPVINLRNDAHLMMQLECGDLFRIATARGLIPRKMMMAARAKAAAYLTANGLSP